MATIPEPTTEIVLDRDRIGSLVKGLLSLMVPSDWPGYLSGAAKTKVPLQIDTYAFVLERMGLPNHGTRFAVKQTVFDILERFPRPDFTDPRQAPMQWDDWAGMVVTGITDRFMGITTEDFPEGLAPEDMPLVWQEKNLS